jgi:GABA permease
VRTRQLDGQNLIEVGRLADDMGEEQRAAPSQEQVGQVIGLDVIRDRMARGPAEFWVLTPATPSTHLVNAFNALSGAFPIDPDLLPGAADVGMRNQGIAEAKSNLDTELDRLRKIGATVDGAVGDPDPMKAIEEALAQKRFDEIILSTLPPGISRWLAWDLPHRVRRRTDVPLTVITAPN